MDDRREAILLEERVAGWRWSREYAGNVGAAVAAAVGDARSAGRVYNVAPEGTPTEEAWVRAIADVTGWAALALGLREGPVHAELRVNEQGPWIVEIAARSIGGLCSRTLRFGTGLTLEELIIRHALGIELDSLERERRPAGVMMLPIPRRGRLEAVRGEESAKAVPGIEELTITAHRGQELVPLPEGAAYLGFLFARADTPAAVEAALREAHRRLEFVVAPPAG
jgi:hypothetical protein